MSANYDVKLNDGFSAAASRIVAGLQAMSSGAGRARSTIGAFGDELDQAGSAARRASNSLGKVGKAERDAASAAKRLADAQLQNAMGQTAVRGQMLVHTLDRIAGAAMRAAQALFRVAAAGAAKLAQSVAFGESLRFSLTRFLGGASQADAAINKLMKTANELGLEFQDAATSFKNFVSAGFSEEAAMNLVKFKADVLALGDGSNETAMRVTEAFKQVEKAMAAGRIEADGFYSILGNLPVNKVQVLTILAKKLGKEVEEVMKMDVTKLPVKELMESFQEATLEATKFGKLGDAALKKQMSTMSGMYGLIKTNLTNAWDALAMKVMPKVADALLPLMSKLGKYLSSSDFQNFLTDVAERLANAIKTAADYLDRFVSAASQGDVSSTLVRWIDDAAKAAAGIMALLQVLHLLPGSAEEGGGALDSFFAVIGWIGDAISYLTDKATWLGQIVTTVASFMAAWLNPLWYTYQALKLIYEAVVWVGEAIGGAFVSAWEWVTSSISGAAGAIISAATSLGSDLISGLVDGIMSMAGAVLSALTGIVGDGIAAAKALLGISSPSKVFAKIGEQTAQGFERGVDGGADAASQAVSGMVAPPPPEGSVTPVAAGGGGGGNVVQIHIDTGGAYGAAQTTSDPAAYAGAVKRMITTDLLDELEAYGLQLAG